MRIIGLDVGTKTVGVALSDPLGITAQPFETITRKENNKLKKKIDYKIKKNKINSFLNIQKFPKIYKFY